MRKRNEVIKNEKAVAEAKAKADFESKLATDTALRDEAREKEATRIALALKDSSAMKKYEEERAAAKLIRILQRSDEIAAENRKNDTNLGESLLIYI